MIGVPEAVDVAPLDQPLVPERPSGFDPEAGSQCGADMAGVGGRGAGLVHGTGRSDGGWASLSSGDRRSEEHTSELQSLMRISYAVFCLKKKNKKKKAKTSE